MASLEEIIETFNSVDDETRLALLLDYAEKLPPLPPALDEERRLGSQIVPECQTPVHIWVLPPTDPRNQSEELSDSERASAPSTPDLPAGEGENGAPEGQGRVILHAWVAAEAPTVQGILSVIVEGCSGRPAGEVASLPNDLVTRLGLAGHLRMNRAVGINAMLQRIRRDAAALGEKSRDAALPDP